VTSVPDSDRSSFGHSMILIEQSTIHRIACGGFDESNSQRASNFLGTRHRRDHASDRSLPREFRSSYKPEESTTMPKEQHYARKISAEEARKGYIFVLKDKLSFFPSTGKSFALCEHEQEKKVIVQSYQCTCRGPELPHEHYFIRWDGVRFGERITITKDKKVAERYNLRSKK